MEYALTKKEGLSILLTKIFKSVSKMRILGNSHGP
jgi:hypothetical protein